MLYGARWCLPFIDCSAARALIGIIYNNHIWMYIIDALYIYGRDFWQSLHSRHRIEFELAAMNFLKMLFGETFVSWIEIDIPFEIQIRAVYYLIFRNFLIVWQHFGASSFKLSIKCHKKKKHSGKAQSENFVRTIKIKLVAKANGRGTEHNSNFKFDTNFYANCKIVECCK